MKGTIPLLADGPALQLATEALRRDPSDRRGREVLTFWRGSPNLSLSLNGGEQPLFNVKSQ
jgi:hypothetical protein